MSKKNIFILLGLVVSIGLAAVIWYQVSLGFRSRNAKVELFSIVAGQNTATILNNLEEKNIISSVLAAKIYLYRHKGITIQAGEYNIEPNTSTRQLFADLGLGKTVSREISLLFREGLSLKEMQAELNKNGYLTNGDFLRLGQTKIKDLPARLKISSFLKEVSSTATLEGFLFPDTYRVYKDFSAEDLAAKMLDNFDAKLTPQIRQDIRSSGHSFEDIVIMASILQKEVRTEKEMKLASGVFWNRLRAGQALQSCATLAYILGENKAQYSYADTQIDSPYNTYQHPGLPPGPVSNPGLMALNAAIHPENSDYNYFLSRPDTGETIFSKTLEEHNAAKAKYLK